MGGNLRTAVTISTQWAHEDDSLPRHPRAFAGQPARMSGGKIRQKFEACQSARSCGLRWSRWLLWSCLLTRVESNMLSTRVWAAGGEGRGRADGRSTQPNTSTHARRKTHARCKTQGTTSKTYDAATNNIATRKACGSRKTCALPLAVPKQRTTFGSGETAHYEGQSRNETTRTDGLQRLSQSRRTTNRLAPSRSSDSLSPQFQTFSSRLRPRSRSSGGSKPDLISALIATMAVRGHGVAVQDCR